MTQTPDSAKIESERRQGGRSRLARGLQALLDQTERQPDGLRNSRRSVVKMLFPDEAERITAILEGPAPSPDGLKTAAQAAAKLNCSIKTLFGHVASGALRYVDVGHGRKRRHIRFADADLDNFIANQTRKDSPCPSTRTGTVARRISTMTSKCEVIGFTALRSRRPGAKPKK